MGWSKRQFVVAAFEEIGLAQYVFDLQPEDLQSAVSRLDAMLATWNAHGIRLGYPMSDNPSYADIDAATNVPDMANEAIFTNLGLRLAPMYGKVINPDARVSAKQAYLAMLSKNAEIIPVQQGLVVAGAGNKRLTQNFFRVSDDPITTGYDGNLQYDGNENLGEDFT